MIQCITACYKICLKDITLKTKFQNFHIKFLNSDFSVSNALDITKFLGDAPCSIFSLFFVFYVVKIELVP